MEAILSMVTDMLPRFLKRNARKPRPIGRRLDIG